MKRIISIIITLVSVSTVQAQNYETIRNTALLQQYDKAKADLDKAMTNTKFTSKPEAYILKTFIYASMAMDPKMKGQPDMLNLLTDADAAFKKYKEMDPSQAMVTDQVYQNGPINIYSGYYTAGYEDYVSKKWSEGFEKFKKAVEYSDLLIEKKLLTTSIDTNILILAGVTAENAGNKEDAAVYYSRLADNKLKGEGFESVYRFLVNYYFGKKNFPLFEKYKATGGQLYPKSDFFTYDKVDFAVGLENSLVAKLRLVDEVLATDPDNFKANQVMGEIIYDTLNPKEENVPLPSNLEELEKKMVAAFKKSASLRNDYEIPWLYLGDHFINKAVAVDKERSAHAADMKTRTKPGTPNSKEDIAKRDALDKKYGDALEQAREPYEKAAALFGAKPSLELKDKQQYKKAVSYLADIAAFKKILATRLKSPDAAKYAAEEKKWNDLWDSIK
jgi:hypothetical protein